MESIYPHHLMISKNFNWFIHVILFWHVKLLAKLAEDDDDDNDNSNSNDESGAI